MIAHDVGEGVLASAAIGAVFMVVAGKFGRVRSVAIAGARVGAVAAAAGAAVALCALVFAGYAIWSGGDGLWGHWDSVGRPQPRYSAMVALGVAALGAALIAVAALARRWWSNRRGRT
jgi:hypothetical protein